ncbi:MAG: hypothetical protein ACI8PZ_002072 [Myxococcota bacterium]
MAGLIGLVLAAHAHSFDPAVLVVEQAEGDRWHLRWSAPVGDPRAPVLPCDGALPTLTCAELGPVGVRGAGDLIVRVRWLDGSSTTGIAREQAPFHPSRPATPPAPWTPLAAVAVAWGAPERVLPFALGLAVGAALPLTAPAVWLAASVALAARDAVLAPGAPRRLWPAALGAAHGLALGGLALPVAACVAALALHRVPALPWLLGPLGVAGVLLEVLP